MSFSKLDIDYESAWRDPGWFEQGGTLNTPEDALRYFGNSKYYDRQCNNEVILMQSRFAMGLEANQLDLRQMVGIEYVIDPDSSDPPRLWTIRKQYRESPTKVVLKTMYYILNSTVYQSPDLHSLLSTRIRTSLHFVTHAFEEVQKKVEFDPTMKFQWKTPPKPKDKQEVVYDYDLLARIDDSLQSLGK